MNILVHKRFLRYADLRSGRNVALRHIVASCDADSRQLFDFPTLAARDRASAQTRRLADDIPCLTARLVYVTEWMLQA
jgi:hypothetical protein